ncbi:protein of unknown function [Maridesulfovibrio hydrothermalis AM13 = DSM 14728]|uniref:Uncharacterized protein n=1 Tax=Maridesulfovibrio hydrothermalis AM13 = DSM 14728 TaxID=1121451 RepID=L0REA3_9BACT|nr:protein of unknown function [Maridesulfovibrio hydrothermalis AM13 = DSM 14728]
MQSIQEKRVIIERPDFKVVENKI